MIALIVQDWTQSCTVVLWRSLSDLKYCASAFGKHCCQRYAATWLCGLTITLITLSSLVTDTWHNIQQANTHKRLYQGGYKGPTNNYCHCQIPCCFIFFLFCLWNVRNLTKTSIREAQGDIFTCHVLLIQQLKPKEKQKILTFDQTKNVWHSCLINDLNEWPVTKTADDSFHASQLIISAPIDSKNHLKWVCSV